METFLQELKTTRRSLIKLLEDEVRTFLVNHPQYTGITWNQGIDGYNDGEPSSFSVEDIHFIQKSDDEAVNYWNFEEDSPEWELATAIKNDEHVLLWLFGTDKRVTITATKASVEKQ